MKIAVYAIAKNEEQHVHRFMDSINGEADAVYVLDTGSTDRTVELLRERGAIVHVKTYDPWRFDHPRNDSMDLIPEDFDVCVSFDLDEVITPGWRKAIEDAWTPATTNLHYCYVWSHNADNTPAVTFWISKIHKRHGVRWLHPVHEIINIVEGSPVTTRCDGLQVHHYPDKSKSRSSYLPLLELAVKETPDNDRNSHYLGREYLLYGRYEEAITELKRHLTLPSATWDVERCASMRFICRAYLKLNKFFDAKVWALRACAEAPLEREPWWELANVGHAMKDYQLLYFASVTALQNGKQGERYIAEPSAWTYAPYDYASVGAHFVGHKQDALRYGEVALEQAIKQKQPQDIIDRITKNVTAFRANVEKTVEKKQEMQIQYFSQIGQDRYYIEKIANFKKDGVFLDIGAHDGIKTSNTAALELFLGWKGVCVEANPELIETLKKNRPAAKVVHCAVWKEPGEVELEISDSNFDGTQGDLLTRISNLDRNDEYFKNHFQQSRRTVKVDAKTVTQVVKETLGLPCVVDYMSLDVEGAEMEALQSIDFSQIDVKFMTIEHGNRPGYIEQFKTYLEQFGYKIHRINSFDVEFSR